MTVALLAISWEPELRGILIVIIAVVVLWAAIYLILATNLGARLGFLVALAALPVAVADGHHLVDLRHRPARARRRRGRRSPAGPCCRTPTRCTTPACSTMPVDPRAARTSADDGRAASPSSSSTRAGTQLDDVGRRVRPGRRRGRRVPRGDRRVRRRRVPGRQRVRHRRRALPEDRRLARLPRLLPQAALRARRGRAARADTRPSRAGRRPTPRSTTTQPAPVRVHGPRPRRPAPAGGVHRRIGARIIFLMLCYLLHRRDRVSSPTARRQAVPATSSREEAEP